MPIHHTMHAPRYFKSSIILWWLEKSFSFVMACIFSAFTTCMKTKRDLYSASEGQDLYIIYTNKTGET